MKKNGFSPVIIILVLTILGAIGYFGYKNLYLPNMQTTNAINKSLVGIWQASGGMASGWTDRYHFYSDGNFHFYPNQMFHENLKIEKVGTWELNDNNLILTITEQVLNTMKWDGEGATLVSSKNVILDKPIIESLNYQYLGVVANDNYPSIRLTDLQFWKFSDDPSSYGDEKFLE